MSWPVRFFSSSIGKKLLMAVTGFGFLLYLLLHLAGNLTMYGGRDYFDNYAATLHKMGPVVTVFELGLLAFALVHAGTGLWLFVGNRMARPIRYAGRMRYDGSTLSSRLMPYTGLLMLGFVVLHLMNFRFTGGDHRPLSEIVAGIFTRPPYAAFYIAMMVVLGLHVRHGFWSAFQTVGANHPKYMPALRVLSVVLAVVFAGGFGFLPVYVYMTA